ncbi:MAG: hypothetical protein MZW92_53975 [Comamonadaceae bacterium]|nr:hypothetical protein [Comamonadaceae bacterium]
MAPYYPYGGSGYSSAGEVVVDGAPPAPYAEVIPVIPFAGAVWLGGYWGWRGGRHHWVSGHWTHPRPGHYWRPHRWEPHRPGAGTSAAVAGCGTEPARATPEGVARLAKDGGRFALPTARQPQLTSLVARVPGGASIAPASRAA